MKYFVTFVFLFFFGTCVFSQADIPFYYDSSWGNLSMSNGNLTSNNAENYDSNNEHRIDETGHYVQLNVKKLVSGTFSVKLIAKTGGGTWSGTVLVQESANGSTWNTLQSVSSIGNNNAFVTPSNSISNGTKYLRVFFSNRLAGSNIGVDNFSVNGVLPVTFSSFTATPVKNTTAITFTTASETNNDYFTIERSGDGRSYDAIGEIDGAGDSRSEIKYTFTDERPLPGINYYRIKQTDFDGRYDFSEVRAVRHSRGNLVVTPRTTEGRLQVVTDAVDYSLEVFNTSGQLVKSFSSLSQDQSISIEDLTAGIYYIRTISGGHAETIRIVKM